MKVKCLLLSFRKRCYTGDPELKFETIVIYGGRNVRIPVKVGRRVHYRKFRPLVQGTFEEEGPKMSL